MKKNIIRLTEQDLHGIIKEAVNGFLKERFSPNDDGTFMDMKDRSTYNVDGDYYEDNVEEVNKRESVMMDYCRELINACHSKGLLAELLKYMRNFEKQHGLDTKENDYSRLDIAPIVHHNASFSPSAERTPKF